MDLRYLYVGCTDTGRELDSWLHLPGARLLWRFQRFGADVAAIDVGTPPAILLADHRPGGSVLPIFAVTDLAVTVGTLRDAGWTVEAEELDTAEGPAAVLHDGSGTQLALLRTDRPGALEAAYTSADNPYAVR